MTVTEAQRRATARYHARVYETVSTRAKRTERINDRVRIAADRASVTAARYVLDAIRDRLDADGVTLDTIDN